MNNLSGKCTLCAAECGPEDSLCVRCQNEATIDSAPGQGMADTPTSGSSPSDISRQPREIDQANGEFGDYDLVEEIARGGMGVVYKARHRKLNRLAAVKMILGGRFSSEDEVQRFYVEAEAAAQLDHPGIVPIYEISEHDGQPFFAMKFVEGGSLAEHRERVRQDPRKVAQLLAQVARAVHHAHQRGILHRDLKPANILLDVDDVPLLTDLGLAKSTSGDSNLTQTGAVLGTPSYMPPEQAEAGQSLTTGADIYSLGAILYEMLVGRPPYQGGSAVETVMQLLNQPVTPPREIDATCNRDLELICLQCLQRKPDDRYASAADLAADLERWLAGDNISVRPPSLLANARQLAKKYQRLIYAVFALVVGFTLSIPIVLSILGSVGEPASLYKNTTEDPRPLIYTYTDLPDWVPAVSVLFVLCLWPAMGILVTLLTRPVRWQQALLHGSVVGVSCALLFSIMLGWVFFVLTAQASSTPALSTLASTIWPPEGQTTEANEKKALKIVPGLADLPPEQRAKYLTERVFADAVAKGPGTWVALASIAFYVAAPIVFGTVLAFSLFHRQGRWWLALIRYGLAWCGYSYGLLIALVWLVATQFGGNFRSEPIWVQVTLIFGPPLGAWLISRRWRQPKPASETPRIEPPAPITAS